MRTYTTLQGRVYSLDELAPEHSRFFDDCYARTKKSVSYEQLMSQIFSRANPVLDNGMVTPRAQNHPLFEILYDLLARHAVAVGRAAPYEVPPDAEPAEVLGSRHDPLEDSWLPISEVASIKEVTVPAIHAAISRGDLIADRSARPIVVSLNSLLAWSVHRGRQRSRMSSPDKLANVTDMMHALERSIDRAKSQHPARSRPRAG